MKRLPPDLPYGKSFAQWLAERGILNWTVASRITRRLLRNFDHVLSHKRYAELRWQHYCEEVA